MPGSVTQVLPSVATIVQAHSIQASRSGNVSLRFDECFLREKSSNRGLFDPVFVLNQHQQQQQIVKVVTASPQTTNLMNAVQHVPVSQAQQLSQVRK